MCFGYLSLAPNKYLCTCQSSPVNQPVASVQNSPCSRDREVQGEQEALLDCCITRQPKQGCAHPLYILPKSGGSHASPAEGRQPGPAWPPSAMVRSTQKLQIIEKGVRLQSRHSLSKDDPSRKLTSTAPQATKRVFK